MSETFDDIWDGHDLGPETFVDKVMAEGLAILYAGARDEEIATLQRELEQERKRLDADTETLLSKYGMVSVCRLPDWNFAIYLYDICCGIGLTVANAMMVAASNIDKIDALRTNAAIAQVEGGEG